MHFFSFTFPCNKGQYTTLLTSQHTHILTNQFLQFSRVTKRSFFICKASSLSTRKQKNKQRQRNWKKKKNYKQTEDIKQEKHLGPELQECCKPEFIAKRSRVVQVLDTDYQNTKLTVFTFLDINCFPLSTHLFFIACAKPTLKIAGSTLFCIQHETHFKTVIKNTLLAKGTKSTARSSC